MSETIDNELIPACPKCGRIASYQTPNGLFWCGMAHYWRPAKPSEKLLQALRDDVIAKARCIRHWHDRELPNGDGMVVSADAVRDLWESLGRLDEAQENER